MAGNEIKTQLVKDISTAISDGVDKVTPTVQEGIHQYSILGLAKSIEGLVMLIALGILVKVSIKWENKRLENDNVDSDEDAIGVVVLLVIAVLTFIGIPLGIYMVDSGINQFIAPLPSLLSELH